MPESIFRILFVILLALLFVMRFYFMFRVRRSGGRLTPDDQAIEREGGPGFFIVRLVGFFLLVAFLVMYVAGMAWIGAFSFQLPAWLRWAGFMLGFLSLALWTWAQIELDTQWSAQLQLTKDHHLVRTGPYARIRHPLYTAMTGWVFSLILLTSNWIFATLAVLTIAGLLWRLPKEEQMMIDSFGDEYKIYMQHTGRFFPRIG